MRLWMVVLVSLGILLAACGSANITEAPPTSGDSEATAAATDAPTPPPSGPQLGEEQVLDAAGLALRPLEDWDVETQHGVVAMSPPDAAAATGPTIVVTVGSLDELNIEGVSTSDIVSTETFYDAMVTSMEAETIDLETRNRSDATIDDQTVQVANFRGDGFGNIESEVGGRIAVALLDTDRAFVMLGMASPAEQWQHEAEFTAVLESVRFVEPAAQ